MILRAKGVPVHWSYNLAAEFAFARVHEAELDTAAAKEVTQGSGHPCYCRATGWATPACWLMDQGGAAASRALVCAVTAWRTRSAIAQSWA